MISVNGRVISDEEVAREAQYHPAASLEGALREAALALVVRELLLQEAAALGIDRDVAAPHAAGRGAAAPAAESPTESITPEERIIEALLERAVDLPVADEETLRRYYEANRDRFRSPDLFEASHILFAARPEDGAVRERARMAAEATLAELRRDPASFERLAKERSSDPETRDQGGHLGQITRGQIVPELEAYLDRLSPGEVWREPIESRSGLHILRLDRALRGRPLTFSMARERVAEHLGASAWTRAVHQYLQLLVGRARIEGIELGGAMTPLVQ